MAPVTKVLPSNPNIPLSRIRPSVSASYWPSPSKSRTPDGTPPDKNSSRAVILSLFLSLLASFGSFGFKPYFTSQLSGIPSESLSIVYRELFGKASLLSPAPSISVSEDSKGSRGKASSSSKTPSLSSSVSVLLPMPSLSVSKLSFESSGKTSAIQIEDGSGHSSGDPSASVSIKHSESPRQIRGVAMDEDAVALTPAHRYSS